MKYLYLFLFMGFSLALSGQEKPGELRQPSQEEFDLYPNPAIEDVVYVSTGNQAGKDITVYDIFGKAVLKARITTNALNISRLVPGVYFLQVEQNNNSMIRKLVVK